MEFDVLESGCGCGGRCGAARDLALYRSGRPAPPAQSPDAGALVVAPTVYRMSIDGLDALLRFAPVLQRLPMYKLQYIAGLRDVSPDAGAAEGLWTYVVQSGKGGMFNHAQYLVGSSAEWKAWRDFQIGKPDGAGGTWTSVASDGNLVGWNVGRTTHLLPGWAQQIKAKGLPYPVGVIPAAAGMPMPQGGDDNGGGDDFSQVGFGDWIEKGKDWWSDKTGGKKPGTDYQTIPYEVPNDYGPPDGWKLPPQQYEPPNTVPPGPTQSQGVIFQVQGHLLTWALAHRDRVMPSDYGVSPLEISGVMNSRTKRALQSYQEWAVDVNGESLRTDGELDEPTRESLAAAVARILTSPPPTPATPPEPTSPPPAATPPDIPGVIGKIGGELGKFFPGGDTPPTPGGDTPPTPGGATPATPVPGPGGGSGGGGSSSSSDGSGMLLLGAAALAAIFLTR